LTFDLSILLLDPGSVAGTTLLYLSSFFLCHPGNRVSDYPGSRNRLILLLGPGYCSTRYARSQFRDDNILLLSQSFLRICHPGNREHFYLSSFSLCHPGNHVSDYPGSRNQLILLLGPGYCSLHSQFRDDKRNNVQFAVPGRQKE